MHLSPAAPRRRRLAALLLYHMGRTLTPRHGVCTQAQIFYNSSIIFKMHGAAFSNVLFMQNDSQILEVMPFAWLKVPGADIISKRYITPISNIHHERVLTEEASRVSVAGSTDKTCTCPPPVLCRWACNFGRSVC